jgi:hypothetical protein
MHRQLSVAIGVLLFTIGLEATSANDVLEKATKGRPSLRSINAISFAPEGVLLIGDGTGSQVFAIDTGDVKRQDPLKVSIEKLEEQLAGRIGTTAKGIEILDLAVNPASGIAYIAVRKQDDKSYIIFTVDGKGKIGEFELDEVAFARIALDAGDVKISHVTDLAWADNSVVAAGRGNESFASKIFYIDAPLRHEGKGSTYSAETYHVSHRRWETKAPMSVLVPFKEDGKDYVVGAFSCTPIVKYPLDSLAPGAKVKGISMIELGSGNRPLDMFVYEKDGKQYVLANTFRFHHSRKPFGPSPYWTVKFEQNLLSGDAKTNENAVRRLKGYEPITDKIVMVEAFHGVVQMDKLDDSTALVLMESEGGSILKPLALP